MSSRRHKLEPYGRWHATIQLQVGLYFTICHITYIMGLYGKDHEVICPNGHCETIHYSESDTSCFSGHSLITIMFKRCTFLAIVGRHLCIPASQSSLHYTDACLECSCYHVYWMTQPTEGRMWGSSYLYHALHLNKKRKETQHYPHVNVRDYRPLASLATL